jgi:hypothetical protein
MVRLVGLIVVCWALVIAGLLGSWLTPGTALLVLPVSLALIGVPVVVATLPARGGRVAPSTRGVLAAIAAVIWLLVIAAVAPTLGLPQFDEGILTAAIPFALLEGVIAYAVARSSRKPGLDSGTGAGVTPSSGRPSRTD